MADDSGGLFTSLTLVRLDSLSFHFDSFSGLTLSLSSGHAATLLFRSRSFESAFCTTKSLRLRNHETTKIAKTRGSYFSWHEHHVAQYSRSHYTALQTTLHTPSTLTTLVRLFPSLPPDHRVSFCRYTTESQWQMQSDRHRPNQHHGHLHSGNAHPPRHPSQRTDPHSATHRKVVA